MTSRLARLWRRLPSWLRAALNTCWATFIASVVPAILTWMSDLQAAIAAGAALPAPNVRLVAGAAIAAGSGLITAIFRYLRPPEVAYKEHQ